MSNTSNTGKPPVQISGNAMKILSQTMRRWTGWKDGRLVFGQPPMGSPHALTLPDERTTYVNADDLILNPNRVLLTVTPFRLRQEAVLTGVMLHEAGHARHSKWLNEDGTPPLHSPRVKRGPREPATKQTVGLARLMEEPRVEGLMARDADRIGARGLTWTMRASAANLMPMTELSADPGQQIMDVIDSWAKRAGRQIAYTNYVSGYEVPRWVGEFTSLLQGAVADYLSTLPGYNGGGFDDDVEQDPVYTANIVVQTLRNMALCTDDTGPTMIDCARDVLEILFPETDGDSDDAPMPMGAACGVGAPQAESESGDEGEGDESGADGEGNTEPEDEGSGDDPGAGDSGDDDAEPDQPDDDGQGDDTDGQDEAEAVEALAKLMAALGDLEDKAKDSTEQEAAEQAEAGPPQDAKSGTLAGTGGTIRGTEYRTPTADDRAVQKKAAHFLRSLVDPTEATVTSLSDAPAATVDGAALSAWKAGGEIRAPHFFRRSRRETISAPPVQIAILVDVSFSMSVLQRPSALLSWAAANAALDLRNFAGRGVQVNSCLIHWGSTARVIQGNGQIMPGVLEWDCGEGTTALDAAHDLIEEQMPGFFAVSPRPSNRLIVQFSDWELGGDRYRVKDQINIAMKAGVNMISVVPSSYSPMRASLTDMTADQSGWVGTTSIMRYDRNNPDQVWDHAAEVLNNHTIASRR